jgi:hypothetical protein
MVQLKLIVIYLKNKNGLMKYKIIQKIKFHFLEENKN